MAEPVWWTRGLKKGFEHCLAFRRVDGDGTGCIVLNPIVAQYEIGHLFVEASTLVELYGMRGGLRTLMVRRPAVPDYRTPPMFPLPIPYSCATHLSYALALERFCLTPWRLWTILVRDFSGMEVNYVKRTHRGQEEQRP